MDGCVERMQWEEVGWWVVWSSMVGGSHGRHVEPNCYKQRTMLAMLNYTNSYLHNSFLPSYFISVIFIMISTKDKI